MKKLFVFLLTAFLLNSCKTKPDVPADILPKEKMQEVMWSMINAGEFLNGYVLIKDSIDKVLESSKVYGQVFQIHHISKEEFARSYAYYREHPVLMKAILDSLKNKLIYVPGVLQKKEDSMRSKAIRDSAIK